MQKHKKVFHVVLTSHRQSATFALVRICIIWVKLLAQPLRCDVRYAGCLKVLEYWQSELSVGEGIIQQNSDAVRDCCHAVFV